MDKIILGLLMYRGMTAYDLKVVINRNFDTMCSNSSGAIHTTLRKLLEKEFIVCTNKDNKKIYSITEQGREVFLEWLGNPMDYTKAKNIELSKLYFLGMKTGEDRTKLITSYIQELEDEYEKFKMIKKFTQEESIKVIQTATNTIKDDLWNEEGIKKLPDNRSLENLTQDVLNYQMEILQYGLDSMKFEIDWYKKLLKRSSK